MAATRTSARPNASKSTGKSKGSNIIEFTAEQELEAYRMMLLIRRFEEKAGQLYGMGLIGGFCHLYIGQEAVVVGMQSRRQGRRQRHHLLPRPRPHAGLRAWTPRA
jgi:pyruvate dehydrogenase E1 component alpha subunit